MRDTLRDQIDLELLSIYAEKDFDPNQPRGPHTGEWINANLPDLPAVEWVPTSNVDAQGNYHVYHGTTVENAAAIRESGQLNVDRGGSPALTTSREQADRYAQGAPGISRSKPTVLEFVIPAEDAQRFLFPPTPHDVYGHNAEAHRLRHSLPTHYLHEG